MKHLIVVVAVIGFAGILNAKTCTWLGGSGSWSDETKWQDGDKPEAGDTVHLENNADDATITNDLGPMSLAYLTADASTGKKVTLVSSGAITLTGGSDVTGGKYVMNLKATGGVVLDAPICLGYTAGEKVNQVLIQGNVTVTFNQAVSGDGKLVASRATQSGTASVIFKVANSFTGGAKFDNVVVYADNAGAFGASKNKVMSNAGIEFRSAGDYDYAFDLGGSPSFRNGGTFNMGPITNSQTISQIQPTAYSSETVNFKGGFDMPNNAIYPAAYSAAKFVYEKPLNVKSVVTGSRLAGGTGPNVFNAQGNRYGTTLPLAFTFGIVCGTNEALNAAATVSLGGYVGGDTLAYLDLGGFDQTVLALDGGATQASGFFVKSAKPATLTLAGATQDYTSGIRLDGQVSLVWNPASAQTQTLNGRVHTMSGDLIVSNGTLKVTGAATFRNVANIRVAAGASFAVESTAAQVFGLNTAAVYLGKDATMSLPENGEFDFNGVFLWDDGANDYAPIPGKAYAPGEIPGISGGKTIRVKDVEVATDAVTWSAGGASDTSVRTMANWDGQQHNLIAGGMLPTFAAAGTTATVDQDVYFKGLNFADAADVFSLVGAGSIALRQHGITVAAPAAAAERTVEISAPIVLREHQSWNVAAGATLTVDAPISADSAFSVTNCGSGTLVLKKTSTFPGVFYHKNGKLTVEDVTDPFGAASDETPVVFSEVGGGNVYRVLFKNVTVNRPVTYYPDNESSVTRFEGTNVFNKNFDTTQNYRPFRPQIGNGANDRTSVVVFNDGFAPRNYFCPNGQRKVGPEINWFVVNNKPFICERYAQLNHYVGLELNATGNLIWDKSAGYALELQGYNSSLKFGVDYALNQTDLPFGLTQYGNATRIYLQGHSQQLGSLSVHSAITELGRVLSPTPALLRFHQTKENVVNNKLDFWECAGLGKSGDKTFTIDLPHSSTSVVEVTEGILDFGANGSWANCTNLTVAGTGTFKVKNAQSFHRRANVTISDTGVIEIPEGTVKTCKFLTFDGVVVPAGDYGGADAPARCDKTYAAHFAGKGVLRARGGAGLVLLVR